MESSSISIDAPGRAMPRFVRLVLTVIIVAVCGSLGMMLYTHYHVKHWKDIQLKRDRGAAQQLFERIDRRFRRADVIVQTQLFSGDKKVRETTLICQRYGVDADHVSSIPLEPNVIRITGDSPVFEITSLSFAPEFQFDDDYADFRSVVAGKTIYLFERIHTEDPKDEGSMLASRSEVPLSCQADFNFGPTPFEKELWHKIWETTRDKATATRHGLTVQKFDSNPIPVRPGVVYRIWAEGSSQPMIHQEEDPKEIADLLHAAETLPPITHAKF